MSVAQAARKIGISASKLYQLVSSRKISHYRIGGKIIFDDDDVAAFLANCHVGVQPVACPPAPARPKLKHLRLD